MKRFMLPLLILSLMLGIGSYAMSADKETKTEVKYQTECPVMGGAIDKKLFVDHEGKRLYVCCAGCIAAVKKEPAKYIKQLEEKGITLAETPKPEKKSDTATQAATVKATADKTTCPYAAKSAGRCSAKMGCATSPKSCPTCPAGKKGQCTMKCTHMKGQCNMKAQCSMKNQCGMHGQKAKKHCAAGKKGLKTTCPVLLPAEETKETPKAEK